MAKMQKLEGGIELNCSAENIFKMLHAKQPDIVAICSHKISGVEAHKGDWLSVGSTRKWDCILGGKKLNLVDMIEAIDEKNMILCRSVIGGDLMSRYRTFAIRTQPISKGKDCCLMNVTFEYEKIEEAAPEPTEFLNFALGVLKDLGGHLSSLN